jgi:hypothetical protein
MSAGELTGWLAAALTLLTFSMQSMLALRVAAVTANLAFIAYGAVVLLEPVLVLHLLLLPCNLFRLCQLLATRRACTPAANDTRPAMSPQQTGRDWLIVSTSDSHCS